MPENVGSLLPVKSIVADEMHYSLLKITKPVLMVAFVTVSVSPSIRQAHDIVQGVISDQVFGRSSCFS